METVIQEIPDLGTVGELVAALNQYPKDMRVGDWSMEPLILEVLQDNETGEQVIEIR